MTPSPTSTIWTSNTGYKGMTLLHLAAALGYSRLVCTMFTWRSENPSVILETEIDALSQDSKGFTPLVKIKQFFEQISSIILYAYSLLRCGHVPKDIRKQLSSSINGITMH